MRIGLVVPGFSADERDWCIPALRHLARALAADDDVRVIALRYPYSQGRHCVDGVETIALGGELSHGLSTLRLWRKAVALLAAEHRRRPFDVLHAFWATESGFLGALGGRLLRVPSLVSLAGGELVALRDIAYGDQRLAVERFKVMTSLRLASAVSAGSRMLASLARRRARRAVGVAPLGVDTALFTPAGVETAESQRFVHVGTLTPVKDHETLLRALAELHRDGCDATLDLVGDGPMRPRLQQLTRELRLDNRVRFLGNLDHAELPRVYRAAHAFVLSSRHEAQGMVAIEAAACGLPLAGTCVGVVPELTRCVALVGNARSLATAMGEALGAQRCGSATQLARSHYSLAACTDRFRALYASVA